MNYTETTIEGYTYLVVGETFYTGCKRCGGTGHYSFDGQSTVCYECRNVDRARLGSLVGDRAEAEKHAHRRAVAKARRDAKRNAEALARMEKMAEAQAALSADVREFLLAAEQRIEDGLERSNFVRSMVDRYNTYRAMVEWGGFSEGQINAIRKVISDRAADSNARAELGPVATGRRLIEGVVQSVKLVEGDWGSTFKMLVIEADGHKVYGSIPNNLLEGRMSDDLIGLQVTLTATVEQSRNDESFGIFKRPTKAGISA
jgi:hypothetical protein